MKTAFSKLEDDLAGEYYPLTGNTFKLLLLFILGMLIIKVNFVNQSIYLIFFIYFLSFLSIFYPLYPGMEEETRQKLVDDHFLFVSGDKVNPILKSIYTVCGVDRTGL